MENNACSCLASLEEKIDRILSFQTTMMARLDENSLELFKLKKLTSSLNAQVEILTDNLLAPPSATPQASGSVCLDENQNEEPPIENESITQIDTQEKLVEFNEMLSSADYFQDVVKRLNRGMKATHYKQRMHDTLYTLFCPILLTKCSWSGEGRPGPKIPWHDKINMLRLFKCMASNGLNEVSEKTVNDFIRMKLKNAVSHAKGKRKSQTVVHKSFSKKKKNLEDQSTNVNIVYNLSVDSLFLK